MALPKDIWLFTSYGDLSFELRQLKDEGKNIPASLQQEIDDFIAAGHDEHWKPAMQEKGGQLLDKTFQLPIKSDYPFHEPSDLDGIKTARPDGPRKFEKSLPDEELLEKVTGAWFGRCIGCLLGKPVEGVKGDVLESFLKLSGQYPLSGYIKFGVEGEAAEKHPDFLEKQWFDDIRHMPIDDDTNYTTTGYLVVKQYGPDFTPANVGEFWLGNIPFGSVCTAEKIAYRNMVNNIRPPASATTRNFYREMIGAQIRADAFGYLAMGNPERAAEFAWRDASISHIKNGIYGEMLMAAIIAAAPYCDDMVELVKTGLSEIPADCRLTADIKAVLDWHARGLTYDEAVAELRKQWNDYEGYDWLHTNSNAQICVIGLLWGENDFGKSICRAVQPGFDTDCNGATVGSIMGMKLGSRAIGDEWKNKVNNTLKTSLMGYDTVNITQIAEETFELFTKIR